MDGVELEWSHCPQSVPGVFVHGTYGSWVVHKWAFYYCFYHVESTKESRDKTIQEFRLRGAWHTCQEYGTIYGCLHAETLEATLQLIQEIEKKSWEDVWTAIKSST